MNDVSRSLCSLAIVTVVLRVPAEEYVGDVRGLDTKDHYFEGREILDYSVVVIEGTE